MFSGSVAVLHPASGVNVALAGGRQDMTGGASDYVYGKLGYLRNVPGVGDGAVSIDYYDGDDIFADGSDSRSWGLAYVQFVDRINTEAWLTYRRYDVDAPDQSFKDGQAFYAGVRFRW